MKVSFSRVLVLAGFLLVSPFLTGSAQAQTTVTTTMTVTANVVASCSVVGGTLAFGNYDPIAAAATDATVQIGVRCTRGVTALIGLSLGANPSGTTRRMNNGGSFLDYELYQDAPRTVIWGTGVQRVTYVAASNALTNFTVFGRVFALQDVAVGAFSDTVTISVTF
jgi:spore coat protein U-like protein